MICLLENGEGVYGKYDEGYMGRMKKVLGSMKSGDEGL